MCLCTINDFCALAHPPPLPVEVERLLAAGVGEDGPSGFAQSDRLGYLTPRPQPVDAWAAAGACALLGFYACASCTQVCEHFYILRFPPHACLRLRAGSPWKKPLSDPPKRVHLQSRPNIVFPGVWCLHACRNQTWFCASTVTCWLQVRLPILSLRVECRMWIQLDAKQGGKAHRPTRREDHSTAWRISMLKTLSLLSSSG